MNHLDHLQNEFRTHLTRRWFFRQCGVGLGSIALGSLLKDLLAPTAQAASLAGDPMIPKLPPFAA